jgi:uncharacterized protein YndB with AHSA1/START domain
MVQSKRKSVKPSAKKKTPARKRRKIEHELWFKAKPAAVYRLWATAAGLESWFAKTARVEAKKGGPFEASFEEYPGKVLGRFLEVEPGRRLVIAWESDGNELATVAAVTFAAERGGTRLRVVHSGFGDGPEWDEWYEAHVEGWPRELAKLFVALEGVGRGKAVSITERVAASTADAWEAIGSAEGLSRWFASGGKLAAKAGGKYALSAGPSELTGTVREYAKGRALGITWQIWPCKEQGLPAPTFLSISLAPDAGGTRVTLVHSGFGDGPGWEGAAAEHEATWRWLMKNLVTVLDHGIDRRARGRSIERTQTIQATPARVFAALTRPKDLARWECRKASIEPRAGGSFRFEWTKGLHAEGTVLAAEPEKRLELAYDVPAFEKGAHPTLVTFELEPEGAGTRLTLVHSGFDGDASWDTYYKGHLESWDIDLEELVSLCERGEPGRVLRCEVACALPARDALAALGRALGVEPVTAGDAGLFARPGSRVRARVGSGRLVVTEAFPGEVDADGVYAGWRSLLASVSGEPVQCGSLFAE